MYFTALTASKIISDGILSLTIFHFYFCTIVTNKKDKIGDQKSLLAKLIFLKLVSNAAQIFFYYKLILRQQSII